MNGNDMIEDERENLSGCDYAEMQDALPEHKRDGYLEEMYEKADYLRDIENERL